MKTKLTLRLDEELIEVAKEEAATRGVSISQMVANFFKGLRAQKKSTEPPQFGPITSQLIGIAKGAKLDEKDYREHLVKKYL
jgi:hypothetical protein